MGEEIEESSVISIQWRVYGSLSLGLGNTVSDIDVSKAVVFSKTKFSMVVPEVVEILEKSPERQNVVLFGIEVSSICFTFDCIKNEIFFYLYQVL